MKRLVCQKVEDEVIKHRGYLQGILKQKQKKKKKKTPNKEQEDGVQGALSRPVAIAVLG